MPFPDTAGSRTLTALVLLAILLRIGSALYQGNEVSALPGIADQVSYHKLALRVLTGHGFTFGVGWWPATPAGQPTAHWSYLYVLFLTGIYWIFGPNPVAARILQAIVTGALQSLLTWRIANRLFGRTAGLVAVGIASVYIYFVYYGGALMTEAFYIVAMLWLADLGMLLAQRSGRTGLRWAQLGVAMGCAALLRQASLLLYPALLAWLTFNVIGLRPATESRKSAAVSSLANAAVATVVLAALIAPFTIRNYRIFGQFVLLNTNAGFAFFWGNHPVHGTHFMPLLSPAAPEYGDLIPSKLRNLNEAGLDRALLAAGLGFVRENPLRYLELSISRAKEYVKFWPERSSGPLSNYARLLSFGLFLPFLFSGVLFAAIRRDSAGRPGVWLLIGMATLYSIPYLLTWTLVRYRLPADALLMPFGALSIVLLYSRARDRFFRNVVQLRQRA